MAGGSRDESSNRDVKGPRPSWARALIRLMPWDLRRDVDANEANIAALYRRLDERTDAVDRRFDVVEGRLDQVEGSIRALQEQLAEIGSERLVGIEARLDGAEFRLREIGGAIERIRDEVIPAVVDRGNALLDRLASELDEVASLVERSLLSEPLPVLAGSPAERELSAALADVQPRLVEAFRGSEEEIRHRLDRYLPVLADAGPVLDLGCGRGELLLMLREAGVESIGLERDPALVLGARRRGLELIEGDVTESLGQQPDDHWGAVTALHLMEHLGPGAVLHVLAEVRRILRPGGLLLVECPNPHTLRVGAAEYWIDPTHLRPLLPETLELFMAVSGLVVERVEFLHPFPAEQRLSIEARGAPEAAAADDQLARLSSRIDQLCHRLDDLLNGPRDFVITASKPG